MATVSHSLPCSWPRPIPKPRPAPKAAGNHESTNLLSVCGSASSGLAAGGLCDWRPLLLCDVCEMHPGRSRSQHVTSSRPSVLHGLACPPAEGQWGASRFWPQVSRCGCSQRCTNLCVDKCHDGPPGSCMFHLRASPRVALHRCRRPHAPELTQA